MCVPGGGPECSAALCVHALVTLHMDTTFWCGQFKPRSDDKAHVDLAQQPLLADDVEALYSLSESKVLNYLNGPVPLFASVLLYL